MVAPEFSTNISGIMTYVSFSGLSPLEGGDLANVANLILVDTTPATNEVAWSIPAAPATTAPTASLSLGSPNNGSTTNPGGTRGREARNPKFAMNLLPISVGAESPAGMGG